MLVQDHEYAIAKTDQKLKALNLPPYFKDTFHLSKEVIYIDFGAEDQQTPGWNNIYKDMSYLDDPLKKLVDTQTYIGELIDEYQQPTGYKLFLSKVVKWKNQSGIAKKKWPFLPESAQVDSIWGGGLKGQGNKVSYDTLSLQLTGLPKDAQVTLTFYAHVSDIENNVQTEIQVLANEESRLYLQPSLAPDLVSTQMLQVKEEGSLDINIRKGPDNDHPLGHFFLGSMILQVIHPE